MPLAADTVVFSRGGRVTLTALKWSGTSVAVSSFVAAITVLLTAEAGGVDCAVTEVANASMPSSSTPAILNCMIASQLFILAHSIRSDRSGIAGQFATI